MIEALVHAMHAQEGLQASDLDERNNNPINLEFAGQEGAVANGRFAKFDSPGRGWAAAYRQVAKWIQQGMTLEQLVTTQAPPNENDTATYIRNVQQFMISAGISVDVKRPLMDYLPGR